MELLLNREVQKRKVYYDFICPLFLWYHFCYGKLPYPIILTRKIRKLLNLPDRTALYQLGCTVQYSEFKKSTM